MVDQPMTATVVDEDGVPADVIQACIVDANGFTVCRQVEKTWEVCNIPPDTTGAAASESCLWPPSHQVEAISITGVTDPDGDPVSITITGVTSDEPTATMLGAGGGQPRGGRHGRGHEHGERPPRALGHGRRPRQ